MRLHFQTDVLPRRMAERLKRAAEANAISMKLMHALNQIARMFGYHHYEELRITVGKDAVAKNGSLTADEIQSCAVARLTADNDLTADLAERLFEPIAPLLRLALVPLDPTFDTTVAAPRSPMVVIRAKKRNRNSSPVLPKVRVNGHGGR